MTIRFFIYGTLKRGLRNAQVMENANFIGEAVTREAVFQMCAVTAHDYPYPAVKTGGHARIRGEVYEVDEKLLVTLDEFEDEEYARQTIILQDETEAEAYIWMDPAPLEEGHPSIVSRDEANILEWVEI